MFSTKAELKPLTDETIENLRAVAPDPVDAMRLAADVYATNAYLAERALAIEAGKPRPKPPKPQSKYMRSFAHDFKARMLEIADRLTSEEMSRLEALQTAIERRLDDNDAGLLETLLLLATMHPGDAALWIRGHLEEIESRFAS
jgi:hypothetical protein